ncbi:LOW QUALITY PROTEIN: uncharacterized protein LOC135195076 [Macrobrachium nipponense]|uniref:LOW QUALITY PROTEIN: uncharacterized protein LOC135195076 n=1 Tax=Macrobrachium nipponense TaxID=159736 RepID=UPI0030C8A56B
MMSQDHQQPGDGEEAGEDEEEEGDMEARTAVAALLALTLPTDYTYSEYEDNYLMDSSETDYISKDLTTKCVPEYDEEDDIESSRVEMVQANESDLPVSELKEANVLESYESLECQETDEGLAQLRAFVQVTEGKNEKSDKGSLPQSDSQHHQKENESQHCSQESLKNVSEDKLSLVQTCETQVTGVVSPDLKANVNDKSARKELPILAKKMATGSTYEKLVQCSKGNVTSKTDLFSDGDVVRPKPTQSTPGRGSQDMNILSPRDQSSPEKYRPLIEGKRMSTLEDSDTDSDSDSDRDSDSDSSDSSSSGSDDASDSDSDSDSDDSKDENADKLGSVSPTLPKTHDKSAPLQVSGGNSTQPKSASVISPLKMSTGSTPTKTVVVGASSKAESVSAQAKNANASTSVKELSVSAHAKVANNSTVSNTVSGNVTKNVNASTPPKLVGRTAQAKSTSASVQLKGASGGPQAMSPSVSVPLKGISNSAQAKTASASSPLKVISGSAQLKISINSSSSQLKAMGSQSKSLSPGMPLKGMSDGKPLEKCNNHDKKAVDVTKSKGPNEETSSTSSTKSKNVKENISSVVISKQLTKDESEKTKKEGSIAVPEKSKCVRGTEQGKKHLKNRDDKVESLGSSNTNQLSKDKNTDKSKVVPSKLGSKDFPEKSKTIDPGRSLVLRGAEEEKSSVDKRESGNEKKGIQKGLEVVKPTNHFGEKAAHTTSPKDNKLSPKTNNLKEELPKITEVKLKIPKKSKGQTKTTGGVDATEQSNKRTSQVLPPQVKKNSITTITQEASKDNIQKVNHIEKERDGLKKSNSSEKLAIKDSCSIQVTRNNVSMAVRKDMVSETSESNYDKEEDKFEGEIDDMFPMPIQAEVVMSEGSESGIEYGDYDRAITENDSSHWFKSGELLHQSDKENSELVAYLQSFVNGGGEGEVVEYPPPNNELPAEGTDLTQWQLDGVHLPPFTPNVAPPSWLRLTIPAEGYRCHSCGDTFFIESSLVQHRERRSVWINLECGPCDAKLTFYNRCALKGDIPHPLSGSTENNLADHLRMHLLHGEEVDEETVDVRSLPLQLTRLLQPILVPVPQSLRAGNTRCPSAKTHGSVTKLPTLKPIGKGAARLMNEKFEDKFTSDEYYDDEIVSSEKIPVGMKRLSPRRRTVRCYLCERMFHSVRELMAHMRTDQPYSDQRVECRKCQLVLPSVCAAKAHILTHPPANTSNVSVCPECGSRCDGPRDFVHHLNTCGHQFRRSGIVCTVCQVCFFKSQDDFLTHWILEHCGKSYECVVCRNTFESLVFHNCQSPGQQVLATFRCLLTCPLCSQSVQLHAQEESDANVKIQAHLSDCHPSIITRVHYVYKSKFCTNAFRSKDELRAHHDREHRRDNHYRTKTCTLHHEVLGYQHQYFNGQEPRNAFVTLPVALSAEELHEARIRDVPTVSSVIDKTLFPDVPSLDSVKFSKAEKLGKMKGSGKVSGKEVDVKELSQRDSPIKKDFDQLDKLRPNVCYRCGYMYTDGKDFRRHKRTCEGETSERQCQVCGFTGTGEDFARHCRGHIQENLIICIYCNGTRFSDNADLEQHFELHVHEQFLYPAICAFCCTSLPDVPTALTHLNEEHDPFYVQFDSSEFECNRCGRRFHGERGLSVHLGRCTLGTATPTPSATGCRQCQVCTKALTPEMFGRHMVSHLEEGLLVCSLCDGRTLPSSMALLHHLEEHAAALAYPSLCPMCNFAMIDTTSALTHMKEEHGFGNLLCADCDMHYNFTYQLQRHTDIVHKICLYAKRRYICWICRAYDHVKKETLMNHFRTVHGLDREQVDEKVMIRTRGQGTMPTSQFIPTKPLGSKEIPGSVSPSKIEGDSGLTKPQKEKSKASPSKSVVTSEISAHQQVKSFQASPVKLSGGILSSPGNKIKKKEDVKLKDKTKVLIKRLPDSVLDDQSRCKKRKIPFDERRQIKKHKNKKKLKVYKCSTCGFGTNSKEKHDNHILKHSEALREIEPDGYVCTECGASFVVEPSLARHMFFAHKVKLPVTSVDENESVANFQEEDVPAVTGSSNAQSKDVIPVQVSSDNGNKVSSATNKTIKKERSESGSDKVNSTLGQEEVNSGTVKPKLESKRKKEGKCVVRSADSKMIGIESKKRKISPVEETLKVKEEVNIKEEKEENEVPIVKEEVNGDNDIKEEKVNTLVKDIEVKDTIAKRKAARITTQKKEKKEDLKGEREVTKIKVEKENSKKRVVKEVVKEANKKRLLDVSVKKCVLKGAAKKLVKDSTKRKAKELKRKTLKVSTKKRIGKELMIAKAGEELGEVIFDDRCVVCKEKFTNPVELYSHLRTHGMAFLKLGRKARPLGMEKSGDH